MTIRQRVTDFFLGDEKRKLEEVFNAMTRAYVAGPWALPPEQLARQLSEIDPYILQHLLSDIGWETLSAYGTDTDAERQRAIDESIRMFRYSALAQWSIWLWTGWGLGDKVTVTPEDQKAADAWEEFWTADRNAAMFSADVIHELSDWLLLRGEQFMAFYASTLDGAVRARTVKQSEITEIITNPNDDKEPWFYKREWTQRSGGMNIGNSETMYYPDWQLFFSERLDERWDELIENRTVSSNAKRADRQNGVGEAGTVVCILHIAHNRKDDDSLHGWPILTATKVAMQEHDHYMGSRLAVAEAVMMFVRRKKIRSGSRGVGSIADTIASTLSAFQSTDANPPAVAGSVELENVPVETTDLPLTTGASHADIDNKMFAWRALLGAGLFPTSAGLDTARWATALEMDKAQSMLFQRYQSFWSAQFKKMVKIVLGFKEMVGETFTSDDAEVSIDSFSLADFPGIASTIGGLVQSALTPGVADGTIPLPAAREIEKTLWGISMQALGVKMPEDELWEEPEEEEAPEPEEEPVEPEDMATEIAQVIRANAREGYVDWENVAEWALAEMVEGNDDSDTD